jgi:hypothetical protein
MALIELSKVIRFHVGNAAGVDLAIGDVPEQN